PLVQALPAARDIEHAPGHVGTEGTSAEHAPGHAQIVAPRDRVAPIAAERFLWQFTVGKSANDKLQYAQQLLSHRIPSGNPAEVARRGEATVDNIRLRCRAHNAFTAACTFGAQFMQNKRAAARAAAEARKVTQAQQAAEAAKDRDVTPWLRVLGYRGDQARPA